MSEIEHGPEDELDVGAAPEVLEGEGTQAEAPALDPEVEATARKYGWKPKGEFTLAPDGWVDADRFLDLAPTKLKIERDRNKELQDQLARIQGTSERALARIQEQERRRFEEEIAQVRAAQAKAFDEADRETFNQARAREAQLVRDAQRVAPEPDPEVTGLAEKYADWSKDPELASFAYQLVEQSPAVKRLSAAKQWAWADRQLRETFPEAFSAPEKPVVQDRAPQVARVDGGGLAGAVRRGKGAADLPPEARKAGDDFVKRGWFKSLDEYAKDYWQQGS